MNDNDQFTDEDHYDGEEVRPEDVGQISLVAAFCKAVSDLGVKNLSVKQMNSIIQAANVVTAAFQTPYQPAKPNMTLAAWLQCDDVGASSKYMAYLLANAPPCDKAWPHDAGDFERCVKFLEAVKDRCPLYDMRHVGDEWRMLVDHWDRLMELRKQSNDGYVAANGQMRNIFEEVDNLRFKKEKEE